MFIDEFNLTPELAKKEKKKEKIKKELDCIYGVVRGERRQYSIS
jgi:hypothetical protein